MSKELLLNAIAREKQRLNFLPITFNYIAFMRYGSCELCNLKPELLEDFVVYLRSLL